MAGGVGPIANLQGKVDANNALEVTGSLSIGGTADGDTFTPGTSDVTVVGGYRDDTAPATVTEGDAAAARITEYRALHVNLRDESGNEVSVGGGTQYTEDAAAAANPVGTALNLVRDDARAGGITSADGDNIAARGADDGSLYVKTLADEQQLDYDTGAGTQATTLVGIALPASGGPVAGGTSTNPIQVGDAGGSLTVDGTVTANAGTNLNTSLLALEAGGNLAGAATSLAVMDDWDESDRAKVNLIVGQAGIAAGTGTDGATVPRVSLATNVALPAGTNALGKLLPPDTDVTGHTNYAKKYYTNAGAVTDGIVWSPAAGKRWHVVSLTINVSAACSVTLEDDKAAGDEAVMKFEFAANSGAVIPFGDQYPLASGEDAADLLVTTTAGNIYITAVGYEV